MGVFLDSLDDNNFNLNVKDEDFAIIIFFIFK